MYNKDIVSNLFDSTIGLDSWKIPVPATFPKYDIVKEDDGTYRMSMALAGYGKSDISVKHSDDALIVEGSISSDNSTGQYLHKGIARRNFKQSFALDKSLMVEEAEMDNGLLNIRLSRKDDKTTIKMVPVK